jgi:hypothetical protein
MNSTHEKAIKSSILKSKTHENNLKHLIVNKFIENNIDTSYIDLIKTYISSCPITTRVKSICTDGQTIFDHLFHEKGIKNRFENKSQEELKIDSYFTYRFNKESKLFNKIYDNVTPEDRVKYGSINIKKSIEGDELAKQYGDVSVFYKETIKDRCTFTYGNSEATMWYVCTYKHFLHLLYHMPIEDIKLIIDLINNQGNLKSNMRTYIEVQIHGIINIDSDIDSLTMSNVIFNANKKEIDKLINSYPQIKIKIY